MEVLAAAAARGLEVPAPSPAGSEDTTEGTGRRGERGSSSPAAAAGASSEDAGAPPKTKAAVAAAVAEEHGARVGAEPDEALAAWTAEVHQHLTAADAAFLAARDQHREVRRFDRCKGGLPLDPRVLPISIAQHAPGRPTCVAAVGEPHLRLLHLSSPSPSPSSPCARWHPPWPQADAARAAARDAFRADARNEDKSADWHAKVAAAAQVSRGRLGLCALRGPSPRCPNALPFLTQPPCSLPCPPRCSLCPPLCPPAGSRGLA